jgi:hypothetical protein
MVGRDKDYMFWPLGERRFAYYTADDTLYWIMDDSAYPADCLPLVDAEADKKQKKH